VRLVERDFQATVIDTAGLTGWRVAHFRPARTERGWRTPVEAGGAGFPDLVLVRDRVVFAELKGARTRVTGEQQAWLDALARAGAETHLWRPWDWDEIERVLGERVA
jgi:VRR-NUC domain